VKITEPSNELKRRESLASYAILDTDPEPSFDDLTHLASFIGKTPIALITLVDEHRQWFKSRVGLSSEETSRDIAFCSHAILQTEMFVVPDALQDARFRDNPLVGGEPHIRFYAGIPLINEEGFALGTLCVIDKQPRSLSDAEISALKALSRLVLGQMELRRNLIALKNALHNRTAEEHDRQHELAKVQAQLMRLVGLETSTR
jgi:GAF domain-containing protein